MPLSDRNKALVGAALSLIFGLAGAWRGDHRIDPSEIGDVLTVVIPPVLAYFGIYYVPNKAKA